MPTQRNYNVYLQGMEKANDEKLFFLDLLDLTQFNKVIDFGCAKGDILRACIQANGSGRNSLCKNISWIGVDHDPIMLEYARKNVPGALFLSELSENMLDEKTLIIFSSVLHEVGEYWETLSNMLKGSGCTVVVRDMCYNSEHDYPLLPRELSNLIRYSNPNILADFVGKYGMRTEKDMIHYLLKYSYVDNWFLELEENYFSFDFAKLFLLGKIIYKKHYPLAYKKQRIKEDFNIDINCDTHIQLIMKIDKE